MEVNSLTNIVIPLLAVAIALAVFFIVLKKYRGMLPDAGNNRLKVTSQRRVGLKAQLILVEADSYVSLIAFSADNIVPIWTHKNSSEEESL
ncbi:hypothetical protein OAD56_01660 [Gammaproteobacteria bacterium]|jgi:flagellar biogenesis protein FliO|nr:hypothetical protein [Gammaproteobacteria bacterium]MDB2376134.1 hypothetical protein [Gammaproteobacteria bacterium]MDB9950095.1 hypothetical protein [Gammaproteobacteria bacterium]MDC3361840.1 hypothetical protein [Gammaproteobacteria bacterium]